MINYNDQSPQILRDFLSYHETIKAHSPKTVDEYFLDLRNFFRYMKQSRDRSLGGVPLDEISIMDVDIAFVRSITLTDIYGYLTYLSRDRAQQQNSDKTGYGLSASTRARKIATLRSFFNYLTNKVHLIENNPIKDLDSPKAMKSLPKYLTLEESLELLWSVDGAHSERDYCILTLFLNCGLRISELIGLNLTDIQGDALRVLGKGNKVRIVYLKRRLQGRAQPLSCGAPPHQRSGSERPLPLFPESAHQPLQRPRFGQAPPIPCRPGQRAVFRSQAAPHRRHFDAAERRGCEGCAGGAGP